MTLSSRIRVMRRSILAACLVCLALAAPAGRADTVITTADAYVNSGVPDGNNGSTASVQVRYSGGGVQRQSYIFFDLSSVGFVVEGATLRLYQGGLAATPLTMDVFAAAAAWTESTVTWSNQPGAAGNSLGNAPTRTTTDGVGWIEIALDAAAIESLRTGNNHGLMIVPRGDGTGSSLLFNSKEHTSGNPPELVVIGQGTIEHSPVAVADSYSVDEDQTLMVSVPGVLGNDSDPDNDPVTAVKVGNPAHGSVTLNADGSFAYTPNANYSGPDSFTYKANDGVYDSATATVSLTVNAMADPPVAAADTYSTPRNVALTVGAPGVLGNDSDPDGGALAAIKVTDPAHGSVTLNGNGSFTYTPSAGYAGQDSFTYKANDGSSDGNTVPVTITVNANTAPVANPDSYLTNKNTPLTVNSPGVIGNDSDPDGNPLTSTKVANPAHGSVTLNSNGSFTYTPATGYAGPDSFTYKANDGQADSNTATVNLTVVDPAAIDWYMAGANPQRTSWVPEEVRPTSASGLHVRWYRPIDPYIPQNVDIVVADGRLFVSTARGLYCLRGADGQLLWVYATEMPLGHSPTVVNGVVYVGGFDRKLHAVDAASGQRLWTWEGAEAGFHTNPLVINGKVILGNRDGKLYAIGAHGTPQQGQNIWEYTTGGPINFSCAYNNGVIYFASMDLHCYAVDENGQEVWKSAKMTHVQNFQSWWPVVWRDKVVFVGPSFYTSPEADLYPGATDEDIGPRGTVPGDWATGSTTIDMTRAVEHYQTHPYWRMVTIINAADGTEYTYDYNGQPAYMPATWSGMTRNGMRTPPTIGTEANPVLYMPVNYRSLGTGVRGQALGWTPGSIHMSMPNPAKHNAHDEPLRLSGGGSLMYWTLCCDREIGAFSRTPGGGAWQWITYNMGTQAPGYDVMWVLKGGASGVWGHYRNHNSIYHNHTGDQNALVPYQGKVYTHRSNCVMAFDTSTAGPTALSLLPTVPVTEEHTPLPVQTVQARLEAQIQKMLDAGRLRPGYFQGGQWSDRPAWDGYLSDYFRHTHDTIWALLRALPHLPPAMQTQLRTYIQDRWNECPPTQYMGIPWNAGAKRENFDLPPEIQADKNTRGATTFDGCPMWGTNKLHPMAFYAMWKYAQAGLGDALTIYNAAKAKINTTPPTDATLQTYPYINNAFIAGYYGYLQLEALAGQPKTQSVENEMIRLRTLRTSTFTKDTPWNQNDSTHLARMSVFWNYKYLTPELADYLRQNALPKVSESVAEIELVAPYWFVTQYEGALQECTIQNPHDFNAVFSGRAWILQQDRAELDKFLDVPFFPTGDLYYIHQLVTLLEAPEPVGTEVVGQRIFRNNSAADGNNPAANASDDNAILAAKTPVEPGQTSSGAAVSSYAKGFNGLMVDISDAANPAAIAVGDFDVQTSPTGAAGSWVAAPAPTSVTVRLGAGQDGSDRVTIIWADNAIQDRWVRVEVKATASTGLAEPDVCYWGNLRGDVTADCAANVFDLLLVQQNYLAVNPNPAADVTGDGNVNVFDLLLVRQQYLSTLPQLTAP